MKTRKFDVADVDIALFDSATTIDDVTDCWLWDGVTHKPRSECWWRMYGSFPINGEGFAAHRVAWAIMNGDIPEGMIVMHKCDVTRCVNPDHLSVGTQRENTIDAYKKGRYKYKSGNWWEREPYNWERELQLGNYKLRVLTERRL